MRKLSKSIGAQVSCEEFKPSIDRKSCTHSNGTTFYNNLIKFKWGSHPRKPTTRGTLSGFKDPTNGWVLGMQPRFYTSIVGDFIECNFYWWTNDSVLKLRMEEVNIASEGREAGVGGRGEGGFTPHPPNRKYSTHLPLFVSSNFVSPCYFRGLCAVSIRWQSIAQHVILQTDIYHWTVSAEQRHIFFLKKKPSHCECHWC